MFRVSRKTLFAIAVVIALAIFLPRLRIVYFLPVSLGGTILVVGIVVLVIFLLLDHLFNSDRK